MKKGLLTMAGVLLTVSLVSAGATVTVLAEEETTLVYGSGDYTRINPAMDEHGEINILIFNGLTAHDGDNQVVPGLAESWDFDDETNTYTFHMAEDAKWQDGEPYCRSRPYHNLQYIFIDGRFCTRLLLLFDIGFSIIIITNAARKRG